MRISVIIALKCRFAAGLPADLKARCAFLSAFVTCKTMTRMVLLWPLRGDIML
jgi:hypothetical protein